MADAINAMVEQHELEGDEDDDAEDDAERREPAGPDVLGIVEAMAAHWESETHGSIMAWSWPLFCTKWARLYEQMVAKRRFERKRDHQRQQQAERKRQQQADEAFFAQSAAANGAQE